MPPDALWNFYQFVQEVLGCVNPLAPTDIDPMQVQQGIRQRDYFISQQGGCTYKQLIEPCIRIT